MLNDCRSLPMVIADVESDVMCALIHFECASISRGGLCGRASEFETIYLLFQNLGNFVHLTLPV